MKLKELKTKSDNELNKLLAANREKLRDLKFKDANKQMKKVRDIRKMRREIAQILTLLKERKLNTGKKVEKQVETKKVETKVEKNDQEGTN